MQSVTLYSVKEVAAILNKSEETINRWLRDELIRNMKFPNAFFNNDNDGWQIPKNDLKSFTDSSFNRLIESAGSANNEQRELVKLAYEAVTLTSIDQELLVLLSEVGIKRSLEVLLIMQQSSTKVKNPKGFIKKAIQNGWTAQTLAIKVGKKQSKRLYELTQNDGYWDSDKMSTTKAKPVPFYNWIDE